MKRTLIALSCLVLLAIPAYGQGGIRNDNVLRADGRPAIGATVRVCTEAASGTPCSPTASIFSDKALTIGIGPTLAVDAGGAFTYYASPGFYKEQLCLGATCITRSVLMPPDVGNMSSGLWNNIRVVDLLKFTTVQTGVTDACSTTPKSPLFIPSGTFDSATAVSVPATCLGFSLFGSGTESSVVRATAAAVDVLTIGDNVTQLPDISIFGLTAGQTAAKTAGAGFNFQNTLNTSLAGFRATNQFQGVRLFDTIVANVDRGYVTWTGVATPTNAVGVEIDGTAPNGGNDQYLTRLVLDGGPLTPQGAVAGFRILRSGATWIDNSDVIRYGRGLLADPQNSGDIVEHLFVMNSAFDTHLNQGIEINPSAGAIVRRSTFTGNWTASNTGHGIQTGTTGTIQAIRFFGHRSYLNQGHGVVFSGGTDLEFSFGELAGNSAPPTASGTKHGFAVAAGVSGWRFIGNRSGPVGGFANTQGWGASVSTGSSDNYIIALNDLRGNVTGGLSDSGTGVNKVIFGNLPRSIANYLPQETGVHRANASDAAYTARIDADANPRWEVRADGVVNPLEGTLSNQPRWIFKRVDFDDMTAGATADTFTLWTLPANTMIHDVVARVAIGWSGGSISAAVCSVGTNAGAANDLTLDDDFFNSGTRYELHDATASGGKGTLLYDATDKFAPYMFVAGGVVEIQCDLTGDNHANATTGVARIFILVSQPLGNTTTEAN